MVEGSVDREGGRKREGERRREREGGRERESTCKVGVSRDQGEGGVGEDGDSGGGKKENER